MSTLTTGDPHGPGKSWNSCPTRTLFANRLVDGKVQAEDAVFLWDFGREGEKTVCINVEVGLLPAGAFTQLGGTQADKENWQAWSRQWNNFHGGGTYVGWMSSPSNTGLAAGFAPWSNTPERLVAGWLSDGKIPAADRAPLMDRLASRIHGFSVARVEGFEKEHMATKDAS